MADEKNELVVKPNLQVVQAPEISSEDITAVMEARLRSRIKTGIEGLEAERKKVSASLHEVRTKIRDIQTAAIVDWAKYRKHNLMSMIRLVDERYTEEDLECDLVAPYEFWGETDYDYVSFDFDKANPDESTSFGLSVKIPIPKGEQEKIKEMNKEVGSLMKEDQGLADNIQDEKRNLDAVTYKVRQLKGDLMNAMLESSVEAKGTLGMIDQVLDQI